MSSNNLLTYMRLKIYTRDSKQKQNSVACVAESSQHITLVNAHKLGEKNKCRLNL